MQQINGLLSKCTKRHFFKTRFLPKMKSKSPVLGPILFNIYASSLSHVIKNFGFNTSGYADDNNAYNTFALSFQYNNITQQLPKLLDEINQWMNLYFLKMNPDKTEIILFLPQQLRDAHTINGCIFSDGSTIRFADFIRNLGYLMDKFMTNEVHINNVVSLCYKSLSDIGKVRHLLSNKNTELLGMQPSTADWTIAIRCYMDPIKL